MAAELKPYPAYKDSGVEWLGAVPAHWEVRRLRNVCGLRVSNVDKHTKEGEVPVQLCNYVDVYRNDRIRSGMAFMAATATVDEVQRFRLLPGDVLITKDSEAWNDIGVPALVQEVDDDVVSGYHLALLRPHARCLDGEFLFRAMESRGVGYQLHVRANGVTRYGLSHEAIKTIRLPVPPLAEQAAIARFLDRATDNMRTAVANSRRQIEHVRGYRACLIAGVATGELDVREAAARLPEIDPLGDDEPKGGNQVDYPAEPDPRMDEAVVGAKTERGNFVRDEGGGATGREARA